MPLKNLHEGRLSLAWVSVAFGNLGPVTRHCKHCLQMLRPHCNRLLLITDLLADAC